jgi:hypothetical protein
MGQLVMQMKHCSRILEMIPLLSELRKSGGNYLSTVNGCFIFNMDITKLNLLCFIYILKHSVQRAFK